MNSVELSILSPWLSHWTRLKTMQHSSLIVLTIFYQMYRYFPTGPNKFKVLKTLKNMKEMCAFNQIKQQLHFQLKFEIQCYWYRKRLWLRFVIFTIFVNPLRPLKMILVNSVSWCLLRKFDAPSCGHWCPPTTSGAQSARLWRPLTQPNPVLRPPN